MLPVAQLLRRLPRGVVLHLAMSGLTVFAIGIQMMYRVPSRLMVMWLPWVGLLLLLLGALMVVNYVLARPSGAAEVLSRSEWWSMAASVVLLIATLLIPPSAMPDVLMRLLVWIAIVTIILTMLVMATRLAAPALRFRARRALRQLEWGIAGAVGAFVILGIVLFANGFGDTAAAVERPSEVVAIGGREIELFGTTLFAWADVRSWRRPGTVERVLLSAKERARMWPGQQILIRVQPGALKIAWVAGIVRDEEKYYDQVLKMAPTAAGPRRERLLFLVERQQWQATIRAAQEYITLYPDDYDFMVGIGASLTIARRSADAVALLEPFLVRQPRNYELLNFLGWGLHQSGRSARGIELLRTAIPIEPENVMAYYHLGYVYRDTGRTADAIAMFEKVLERRRNYPEIEHELRVLRERDVQRAAHPG